MVLYGAVLYHTIHDFFYVLAKTSDGSRSDAACDPAAAEAATPSKKITRLVFVHLRLPSVGQNVNSVIRRHPHPGQLNLLRPRQGRGWSPGQAGIPRKTRD